MKILIACLLLGVIGVKTSSAKCLEGANCAEGAVLDESKLVEGIAAGGFSNDTSFLNPADGRQNIRIKCGGSYCQDYQTCCGYSSCCSLMDTRATCCSGNACCPSGHRCCGYGRSAWCCGKRDACASSGLCIIGGRAAQSQTVTVASVILPLLVGMIFVM